MENVIPLITTPLALAALAILVLGAIYQGTRGRSVSGQKYVFWIILVLGILGNVAYLTQVLVFSEAQIRGDVRDLDGKPIPSAIVDVSGVGRTASLEDGTFEISVPYSRQRATYDVFLRGAGLDSSKSAIKGPRPDFLSLVAKKRDADVFDFLDIRDIFSFSQNIGDPLISFKFQLKRKIETRAKISASEVRLKTPKGQEITFVPWVAQRDNAPFQNQYLKEINVDQEMAGSEFVIMFTQDQFRPWATVQSIQQRFGPQWLFGCVTPSGLDDGIVEIWEKYFDGYFIWEEGTYELTLRFRIDDRLQEVTYSIAFPGASVNKMRSMKSKLKTCGGLMLDTQQIGNLSFVDGVAENFSLLKGTRITK
jgi:hypothetical protein